MSQSNLLGAWRLVSGEVHDPLGRIAVTLLDGMLHYTASGHMSVQIIVSPQQPGSDIHRAVGDFIAYFGTYAVSEDRQLVTHHLEGGYGPYRTQQTLVRHYELIGDRLALRVDLARQAVVDPGTGGRIVWERLR